jgi:hypothetical protein
VCEICLCAGERERVDAPYLLWVGTTSVANHFLVVSQFFNTQSFMHIFLVSSLQGVLMWETH